MLDSVGELRPDQPLLAVAYHSPYGHTRRVAEAVATGAAGVGVQVWLQDVAADLQWSMLDRADTLVLGSPVYMGSVSAGMKTFMDGTSKRWKDRLWAGKLAAGFANSGGLSGDKLAVLQQLCLFAMQHGMLWSGLPLLPTGTGPQDLNRMAGFLGLMTQSDNAPVAQTPPEGDLRTAHWFGEHLAQLTLAHCRA